MRRKIAKMGCLFVCLCLVLAVSSCSVDNRNVQIKKTGLEQANPDKAASEAAVIKIWHIWTSDADKNKETFDAAAKVFSTENPDIKLDIVATETEIYKYKIRMAIAANEAPDVFYSWGGGFSKPFVDSGKVLQLDDYLNDGTRDKLLDGVLTYQTYDGKVYGLPFIMAVSCLFANSEMFEQNGIKLPETFDELLEAAVKFRAKGITPINVAENQQWTGILWYDALALRTAGAQTCFDALSKKIPFNQPAFINAAEKLDKLVKAKAFNSDCLTTAYVQAMNPVKEGKVPMILMGSWACSGFEDETSKVKGKMVPLRFPLVAGGQGGYDEFNGGAIDSWMASAYSNNKPAAIRVVKGIAKNMSKEGYERNMLIPVWKVKADESLVNPLMKQVKEMVKNSKVFVTSWDTFLEGEDAQIHLNLVAEIFAGKITPEQFAQKMMAITNSNDAQND